LVSDEGGLFREGRAGLLHDVDQSAFADLDTQQVGHQPGQAFKRNALGKAHMDRKRPQVRPKGRAGLQTLRRIGFERFAAARACTAKQGDARDVRLDGRNFDPVVGLHGLLRSHRDIGMAMLALEGGDIEAAGGIWMQRPMRARMGLLLGLWLVLLTLRLLPL